MALVTPFPTACGGTVPISWWRAPQYESPPLSRVLVHFIPGNPGHIDFYSGFLSRLYAEAQAMVSTTAGHGNVAVEVAGVPHAGHKPPTAGGGVRRLFGLDDQVRFHTRFARRELATPVPTRIVLIGHSVGAYIAIKLLSALPASRVARVVLLYPTYEHIADTPHGRLMSRGITGAFSRHVAPRLAPWLSRALTTAPGRVLLRLCVRRLGLADPPGTNAQALAPNYRATVEALAPALAQMAHMGRQEMAQIKELPARDRDALRALGARVLMLFATGDGWAPLRWCHRARAAFAASGDAGANAVVELDADFGIEHAFSVDTLSSLLVANRVAGFLREELLPPSAATAVARAKL